VSVVLPLVVLVVVGPVVVVPVVVAPVVVEPVVVEPVAVPLTTRRAAVLDAVGSVAEPLPGVVCASTTPEQTSAAVSKCQRIADRMHAPFE
jgi:hypothetical protein